MSEPTRRFLKLPEGTMHESAHGDWVRYGDLAIAIKRAEAAEAERDAARDKNIELHNRVRTYNNRAKKLGQKQKKNHKLATYAEESNELLRAEREALRKDAARYRWLKPQLEMDWDLGNPVYLSLGLTVEVPTHVEVSFDLDATIDAALAVQSTTGDKHE